MYRLTARAAATPATGKRQRKEEDRAGQAATATAKPHSDTRQMDAAMEGGGGARAATCAKNERDGATTPTDAATEAERGAAREVTDAEPAAKKKKRRGTSKTGKGCKSQHAQQRHK